MTNTYFFNGNPITYGYVVEVDHTRMADFAATHGDPRAWSSADWDAYEEDNVLVRALYALAKKAGA